MGNNLNLIKMLGVPEYVHCPSCDRNIRTYFEDYDIECGDPNPFRSVWHLNVYCPKCDYKFTLDFMLTAKNTNPVEKSP
jgi:C4-type Zn-finger protein